MLGIRIRWVIKWSMLLSVWREVKQKYEKMILLQNVLKFKGNEWQFQNFLILWKWYKQIHKKCAICRNANSTKKYQPEKKWVGFTHRIASDKTQRLSVIFVRTDKICIDTCAVQHSSLSHLYHDQFQVCIYIFN